MRLWLFMSTCLPVNRGLIISRSGCLGSSSSFSGYELRLQFYRSRSQNNNFEYCHIRESFIRFRFLVRRMYMHKGDMLVMCNDCSCVGMRPSIRNHTSWWISQRWIGDQLAILDCWIHELRGINDPPNHSSLWVCHWETQDSPKNLAHSGAQHTSCSALY